LGIHPDSLKTWVSRYKDPQSTAEYTQLKTMHDEMKKLKSELKRVTEERDILKKAPLSDRAKANEVLIVQIKKAYAQSNNAYGYRNIHKDLIESGIAVNKKRVARLMITNGLYGAGTLKKKPRHKAGSIHKAHPNHLKQCFNVEKPNEAGVTDITYIRTYEGWLYLAVVLDLFSRKVIGWGMSHRMTTSLAMDALRMATMRQRPKQSVILHFDQGSQYSSYDWQSMLKHSNIIPSMSR